MPLTKLLQRFEYLDRLIRFKNTGTPAELAEKLGVSESTLFQCLKELREDLQMPIAYDADKQSYVYTEEGKFFMGFLRKLSHDEMAKIKAGTSYVSSKNFYENFTKKLCTPILSESPHLLLHR